MSLPGAHTRQAPPDRPLRAVLVLGTRPEAVKLAPVFRELHDHPDTFSPEIWLTAQHRTMLDQVLTAFDLPVRHDFNLMQAGQTLAGLTAAVLHAVESALREDPPDLLLVQGDTTTVFAAALAAFYAGVPVGHVEAGLRTHDPKAPFPEELNRQMTARLAQWHFAPTATARENLLAEGIPGSHIWVTGNTVIDALDEMAEIVRRQRAAPPA